MKRVYFVRHGSTEDSQKGIQQSSKTSLSEKGKAEAAVVAERIANIQFDQFFSSTATRAIETAVIIGDKTKKTYEASSLFAEYKRPSRFVGVLKRSDEYQKYLSELYSNADNEKWVFEDSESFCDFRKRISDALSFVENAEGDVVVVTHQYVCKCLMMHVLTNGALSPEIYNMSEQHMKMDNDGVTIFSVEDGLWKLITWNDHVHFAE